MASPPTQSEDPLAHLSDEWREAFHWIESELGGRVVRVERQPRWRPAWFFDLERAGGALPLYFRGERGETDHGVYALEHEMRVLQALAKHDVPVPRVYGFCPEPKGIVMDRCPGRANLATASSEAERLAVMDDYVDILARIHQIDPEEFVTAGLTRPRTAEEVGLGDLDAWESGYRRRKRRPEPALEFPLGWVRRHVPENRRHACFVCNDSGQFLFEDGRVTAILDLELATLGDPMADLAGMRSRDLSEPLGDLSRAFRRYEDRSGERIDRAALDFHTVRFCAITPLAVAHLVASPPPGTDWVQYFAWYLVWTRACLEVIGDQLGIEVPPVELPDPEPGPTSAAHDALVSLLRAASETKGSDPHAAYQLDAASRIGEYVRRAERFGPAMTEEELDEAGELLGWRPTTLTEADEALEQEVVAADPSREPKLVRFFHRRVLRQEALLRPVMRELEHSTLQQLD